MVFTTIQELLEHKHRNFSILSVEPETTVDKVLALMLQADVRHVLVVDSERRLLGLISQADLRLAAESPLDYPHKDILQNMMSKLSAHTAGEIMIKQVTTVQESDLIVDAAKLMRLGKIGALPVLRGDKVVGICTRTDLLDHLIRVLEPLSAQTPSSAESSGIAFSSKQAEQKAPSVSSG